MSAECERKQTSNVTVPPRDDDGWRRVALHIAPLAERMQTVLGPCCEKVIIFLAISCNREIISV